MGMHRIGCKISDESRRKNGNTRGMFGSGCKVPENAGEWQGNVCVLSVRGMHGNSSDWVLNPRRMQGESRLIPGERMGLGTKCQKNAGE